jgi:hypothetical protein
VMSASIPEPLYEVHHGASTTMDDHNQKHRL